MDTKILVTKTGMETFFDKEGRVYGVTVLSAKQEKIGEVLKEGDRVTITGISKGKGFAGAVKRHHFKGGPRTHGQSDRERAPGSIGSTTTPGRVMKGKRMAGKMGNQKVTIKNQKIVKIDAEKNTVYLQGAVPGIKKGIITLKKNEKKNENA